MSGKSSALPEDTFSSLTEGLASADAFTRAWLTQVILRMRRELAWLWRRHEPVDWLAESLERHSTAAQRRKFYTEDPAASYLDQRIRETGTPAATESAPRGTFAWLARELELTRAGTFVVAMGFAAARDAAVGNLFAALAGDARRQWPTLALAQWLWDEPNEFAPMTAPAHPLFARGILRRTESQNDWNAPFSMPAMVARCLEAFTSEPAELQRITAGGSVPGVSDGRAEDTIELELLARRLAHPADELRIVPVLLPFAEGTPDARRAAPALARIAAITGRDVYAIAADIAMSDAVLATAATWCWLNGADLLLPSQEYQNDAAWRSILRPYPIYVFAVASEEDGLALRSSLPPLKVRALNYAERREVWQRELARRGVEADENTVRDCAYRFRLDAAAIADVASTLSGAGGPLTPDRVFAACQQQIRVMVGSQAALVTPRFRRTDLILDADRSAAFDQLLEAMRNLSRVHAEWGTGPAWGDAGISVLFAGPSGTGKTMSAEVLANELRLPLYHVDLSQVVNKYIGETEKNLRRLFDAAEQADIVLFFDEADALFGQRMQARSSNDRFANMEISYLLERMDRFRGLAILATNRKRDLDEAFLRRLRYTIEFSLPAEPERLALWKQCIPPEVATEDIDYGFLAREFALAGGNIRSIVLNACLDAASTERKPALPMGTVMRAVEREYEKLGRPLSREQKMQWRGYASGSRLGLAADGATRSGAAR